MDFVDDEISDNIKVDLRHAGIIADKYGICKR